MRNYNEKLSQRSVFQRLKHSDLKLVTYLVKRCDALARPTPRGCKINHYKLVTCLSESFVKAILWTQLNVGFHVLSSLQFFKLVFAFLANSMNKKKIILNSWILSTFTALQTVEQKQNVLSRDKSRVEYQRFYVAPDQLSFHALLGDAQSLMLCFYYWRRNTNWIHFSSYTINYLFIALFER